jgi:hypothetical protein
MLRSFRTFGTSIAFLLLGFTFPAHARQGHEEKPKEEASPQEQSKPAEKQQQPARQQQPQATKQQSQPRPQQQEQKPPQQAAAPQQQAKAQAQPQNSAPKQQHQAQQQPKQQAKVQQGQQHQQPQQQKEQPQQQARVQQDQHSQTRQAGYAQRPRRTQQAMDTQHAQPELRLSARGSGRIPDARFQSNFGRGHEFHMGNPVMVDGYSRFQYGGYWFGFDQPWPVGWYYTDDVYIDYVDGAYYMYDPYYPGARFEISVVL